jgi:hypothetical protein
LQETLNPLPASGYDELKPTTREIHLNRTSLTGALILCAAGAAWAQNQPAPQPPDAQIPEVLEERAHVRRFSAGITLNLSLFPQFAKETQQENIDSSPPIELRSNIDPNTRIFGWGAVAQVTLTERLALAVHPTLKNFNAHTFMQRFEGVNNPNTSFDDRDNTDTDETITGKHIDVPILLRLYSKGHHESGPRWLFEAGPAFRLTRSARVDRRIVPPDEPEIKESVPFNPDKKTGIGFVAGIGGQFIDDFGIRAIPEVRYTRWFVKPYTGFEGRTRGGQIEILFTLSF